MINLSALAIVAQVAGSSGDSRVAAVAAVIGALVGALAAVVPNWLIEKYRTKREAEQVEASLVAEVSALLEIASERKYLDILCEVAADLRSKPAGATTSFAVQVPPHYSRIFQANAHRIGLLPAKRAADIVRFHQLLDAVVQDFIPGGAMSQGAPLDAFEQSIQIFSRALALGGAISNGN